MLHPDLGAAPGGEGFRSEIRTTAIDAETLLEILHRYRAIGRWGTGRQVYDLSRQLFPSVAPISAEKLDRARALLDHYPAVMARDARWASHRRKRNLSAMTTSTSAQQRAWMRSGASTP